MDRLRKLFQNNAFTLLVVFLLMEVIANPLGEFALNDDWSYAKSVETLSLEGSYDIGYWPAMTLISHVLWGFLFTKVFGFSFTVLRVSVITLSFIALLVTEKLVFNLTGNKKTSLYAALLLLVNPLFFSLSNTFMTDATFLAFCVFSLYFYERFFTTDHNKHLLPAFLMSLLALFTRQLAIVFPAVFALVAFGQMLFKKQNRFYPFVFSVFALAISIGLIYLYEQWIFKTMVDWASYQGIFFTKRKIEFDWAYFYNALESRTGLCLLYAGLCLFPVVLFRSFLILKAFTRSKIWPALLCLSIAIYTVYVIIGMFPFGNVLYNCGLGIETTIDTLQLKTNLGHGQSDLFVLVLKIVSIVGIVFFMLRTFSIRRFVLLQRLRGLESMFPLFAGLVLVFYTMVVCLSSAYFDRYALFFSFCWMLLFFIQSRNDGPVGSVNYIPLVVVALFSVFATKDYFNYNRKKEEAISYLQKVEMVSPEKIHGGFEYFMWNYYKDGVGFPMWDAKNSDYLVTFVPVENYHRIANFPYHRYIPSKTDTIFVLEKNAP